MKLSAAMLLILLTALTAEPAVSASMQSHQQAKCIRTCNMARKCGGEKKKKKERTCDNCNPFMSCVMGNFFLIPAGFNMPAPSLICLKESALNEKVLSSYLPDCWHPPEFGRH